MLTVLGDQQGVVMRDFLQKDVAVMGAYHVYLLSKLREAIKIGRCGLLSKYVLLVQDNSVHNSHVAQMVGSSCEILRRTPYSPDLVP